MCNQYSNPKFISLVVGNVSNKYWTAVDLGLSNDTNYSYAILNAWVCHSGEAAKAREGNASVK